MLQSTSEPFSSIPVLVSTITFSKYLILYTEIARMHAPNPELYICTCILERDICIAIHVMAMHVSYMYTVKLYKTQGGSFIKIVQLYNIYYIQTTYTLMLQFMISLTAVLFTPQLNLTSKTTSIILQNTII